MSEITTSEKSAMFLQTGMGTRPMFRGFHAFSGDMAKADGATSAVYYVDAGQIVKAFESLAAPELVSVNLDAPLAAISDLVGARVDCPIHLIMVSDKCLPPDSLRSWGRWGSADPQVMLLISDARVEQRTLSNLMARESNTAVPLGAIQVKFDDWAMIKGGSALSLYTIIEGQEIAGIASTSSEGCADPECGGDGKCLVWYVAAVNGSIWRSGLGLPWTQMEAPATWAANTGGVYADDSLVLVGGSDGVAGAYGVLRSPDGGETWQKVPFATSTGLAADTVVEIVRTREHFYAFGSSGIWRSTDDGRSWQKVLSGIMRGGAFDATGLGVAITASRVYASRSGQSWKEVSAIGSAQEDVTFAGGYVHIVDSEIGYKRAGTNALRKGKPIVWELKDTTQGVTDIGFANPHLGYRLRGTSVDRTLNGGYSWETLPVSGGAAPTLSQMVLCGGRLGLAGGAYFGYYSPFFDTDPYISTPELTQAMIIHDDTFGLIFNENQAVVMGVN